MKKIIALILMIVIFLMFVSCTSKEDTNPWDSALYTQDTELGEGATTINVKVDVLENSVDFKINTDKETLGDALMEHKLISGEVGAYGMYVKFVNGIYADYDTTKTYWAFEKDGQSLMTGVDGEKISNGANYRIIYTEQ